MNSDLDIMNAGKLGNAFTAILVTFVSSATALGAHTPAMDQPDGFVAAETPQNRDFPRYAQVGGEPVGGDEGASGDGGDGGPGAASSASSASTATPEQTNAIVAEIEAGGSVCEEISQEYRLDCIAKSFRKAATRMSPRGEYGDARAVLLDTATRLEAIVKSERDRSQPRIRARAAGTPAEEATRPLSAVRADRVRPAHQAALAVIDEAETVLLRSSESASKRSVHYQRIAAAVGSNKVILRSS